MWSTQVCKSESNEHAIQQIDARFWQQLKEAGLGVRSAVREWTVTTQSTIWSENWKDSGSISTRIACTFRSTATGHQKLPPAVLTSTDSSGNLIAVGYISYL